MICTGFIVIWHVHVYTSLVLIRVMWIKKIPTYLLPTFTWYCLFSKSLLSGQLVIDYVTKQGLYLFNVLRPYLILHLVILQGTMSKSEWEAIGKCLSERNVTQALLKQVFCPNFNMYPLQCVI